MSPVAAVAVDVGPVFEPVEPGFESVPDPDSCAGAKGAVGIAVAGAVVAGWSTSISFSVSLLDPSSSLSEDERVWQGSVASPSFLKLFSSLAVLSSLVLWSSMPSGSSSWTFFSDSFIWGRGGSGSGALVLPDELGLPLLPASMALVILLFKRGAIPSLHSGGGVSMSQVPAQWKITD
jgi:hypothetical protein